METPVDWLPERSPTLRPSNPTHHANSQSGSSTPTATYSLNDDDFPPLLGVLDFLVLLDAHLELATRGLRKKSDRWKSKADKMLEESRIKARQIRLKLRSEEERDKFEKRLSSILDKWEDEKVVRLRDKLAFFFGVMNVVGFNLLLGFAPQWIPHIYTLQAVLMLPYRAYSYKKKSYHYFLFDLCYAINLLVLVYLWILPESMTLFTVCWGLSLGSLGTAIATWRNSLVFHSLDKVISLAIHLLPPFVMVVIRHFLVDGGGSKNFMRWKVARADGEWNKSWAILICMIAYLIWQLLYYRFLLVAQRSKIASGQRVTSFTWMMNDTKSLIGKIGARVREEWREAAFMVGQAIYTLLTLLVPILFLHSSSTLSSLYLLLLFSISVWNGASFYMDVFSRGFERELGELKGRYEGMLMEKAVEREQREREERGDGEVRDEGKKDL